MQTSLKGQMDNLDQITKSEKEVNETFINYSRDFAKLKIQYLYKNFDTLSNKDLAEELKELGKTGETLKRHNK